ncbi:efflux RND transporter periplasmic adaptor subunit [Methylobacterium haplocladii]|uniref:Hemolysin secretion protein D n=2 Tax=Methylobacterium haplocladii TaxID=1176176 RepID=A0A512IRT7_9HYPH|nr:efflux RND transporter periplasmic adaptor subunit [Methylobacterium haplocladii]GEP00339.1 hemolysin secretion protein D [Methylobacterium haplocladii]GLS61192.1 hemolysin secretion protein D [Methylobacterium haplocladii]
MKLPRKLAGSALLSLGIALAASSAQAEGSRAPAKASLIPAVSVVEAARREIVESVVVTGTLVPRDEILVTPEIDGYRVTEVLVEEGMRVQRGQVLARLSHDLIDRQLVQQSALVDKASAAVPQAQSSIEQAEATETEARLSYDRARQLLQTGNATAVVMESRTAALRQAEGKLAFARNGLLIAKAELAQAKAVQDELELRLARTEIRAPEAGIVNRRTARVGITASSAAEPLFRLIARGEIELEGEVIETKLPLLHEGRPAWIELGSGERVRGSVRAVYPEVDKASRLGKVRIRLDADPRLRIGTFARGAVELARTRGVTVPQASVLYGGTKGSSVLVAAGGRVEAREVRIGLSDDDDIEIRTGLTEGERVVARAGSFLRDGDRVRPIPVAAAAPAVAEAPSPQASAEAGAP